MYSGKKAQHDFPKMRGGGDQRPFGTFPKFHHFWRCHPSLRWSCIILVNALLLLMCFEFFSILGLNCFAAGGGKIIAHFWSLYIYVVNCWAIDTLHYTGKPNTKYTGKLYTIVSHSQRQEGAWELGKLGSLCLVLLSGKDNLLWPWFFLAISTGCYYFECQKCYQERQLISSDLVGWNFSPDSSLMGRWISGRSHKSCFQGV